MKQETLTLCVLVRTDAKLGTKFLTATNGRMIGEIYCDYGGWHYCVSGSLYMESIAASYADAEERVRDGITDFFGKYGITVKFENEK